MLLNHNQFLQKFSLAIHEKNWQKIEELIDSFPQLIQGLSVDNENKVNKKDDYILELIELCTKAKRFAQLERDEIGETLKEARFARKSVDVYANNSKK